MMWLLALSLFVAFLCALPSILSRIKRADSRHLMGFTMALGLIFAELFEPVKRASIEELQNQKEGKGSPEQKHREKLKP